MLDPPDLPRWVEYHGMRAAVRAWTVPAGPGAVAGDDEARLMVATTEAATDAVLALAAARPGWTLLVAPERDDLRAALAAAGADVALARLHTLPDPAALPADDGDPAEPLPADAALAHVPPELLAELERARREGTVWVAALGGAPVAFAYASWRSPRWFDVSVDTLPAFRGLGLATRAAAALIRAELAGGRAPVWGAVEDNLASLRLAARLGFVEVDQLLVVSLR